MDKEAIVSIFHPKENPLAQVWEKLKNCTLSLREKEVIELIFLGKSNQEIVEQLFISKATLKTHLNHIYKKASWLKSSRKKLFGTA